MKKLTKKQKLIIENLNPKCEDCIHYLKSETSRPYLDNDGKLMCYFMYPFAAYKEARRLHPHGKTFNCGIEGQHFFS